MDHSQKNIITILSKVGRITQEVIFPSSGKAREKERAFFIILRISKVFFCTLSQSPRDRKLFIDQICSAVLFISNGILESFRQVTPGSSPEAGPVFVLYARNLLNLLFSSHD
jgi:hypothetical protein